MTETLQTITVTLPEGGSSTVSYYGTSAIHAVLTRIRGYVTTCKQKDDQEAAQGADTAQCPDRGAFEEQANAIKNGADTALSNIWNTFDTQFQPKSQVIQTLVNDLSAQWSQSGIELDTIQGHVQKHINEDSWQSQGAQEYKAALPTQSKALYEFEELCYRATNVLTSAAAINAAIFYSLYQSLINIEEPIRVKANTPVKNLEYWSDHGSSVESNGCVSYEYYTRSATAKANLEGLESWLNTFLTTQGEWSTGAYQVADDIPQTQGSVANLKPAGQWPEPRSVVTADANVDDQTSHTGTRGSTSGQTVDEGVDLNNRGGIFG
ncbi:hypothetical protein ACPCG0_02415 [Propionibacteriaceae bacterium Y1923]|uniref:hypothetical protein n=1 Tax=Aestuariimicrobium sp. Y1814 TaxID=3418742 RepID=UPI003C1B7DF6